MEAKPSRNRNRDLSGSSCFARVNGENVRVVENYLAANLTATTSMSELAGTLCKGRLSEGPSHHQ
jgi:hypothetical protein